MERVKKITRITPLNLTGGATLMERVTIRNWRKYK